LLVYKVILANIDIPSLESISEMRGVVNSIVEKKDGISFRLDDIDGVFFYLIELVTYNMHQAYYRT
jgi:hypothetical protein